MATEDYVFTGYHDDDAKLLNKIIEDNWEDDPLKSKKLQYYDESKDISSVNFNTGEVAIKIYADDAITSPRGIGFDSIEQDRYINIEVRTIDRDLYLGTLDELRRIFIKYRLRPGNAWDTMWLDSYAPVYPSEKFYHGKLVLHLKQYCHSLPRPRDGWHRVDRLTFSNLINEKGTPITGTAIHVSTTTSLGEVDYSSTKIVVLSR